MGKPTITINKDIEVDLGYFNDEDLVLELKSRKYNFNEECTEDHVSDHFDENEVGTLEQIRVASPSEKLPNDNDIISRFVECHHLLKWEQWNYIFYQIERESRQERAERPEKFNKV